MFADEARFGCMDRLRAPLIRLTLPGASCRSVAAIAATSDIARAQSLISPSLVAVRDRE